MQHIPIGESVPLVRILTEKSAVSTQPIPSSYSAEPVDEDENSHTEVHEQKDDARAQGYLCKYCKKYITDRRRLNIHISAKHPERLMLEIKERDISLKAFRSMCKKLLNSKRKWLDNDGVKYPDKKKGKVVGCAYCEVIYANAPDINRHLVDNHFELVAQCLKVHQKNILI